eukprot:TRINITY_DN905_c0_g1_i2.p1 TRINITY_DN905_c0_g1~~TRINITY_DN905_c0_g1_i2.p1  ORF type:complete len:504 (-),score=85.43 TRINITY_DN905_c0_g1_i2:27-1538(-)
MGHCNQKNSDDCEMTVYVSDNTAKSWLQLRTYVWMYAWLGYADDPNRVILWEDTVKQGDQRDPSESVVSIGHEPLIWGFKPVIHNVTGFLALDDKVFAARPTEESEGLGLYISDDNGETFRFAKTPTKVHGKRFTILDATPGSVFVNVEDRSNTYGKVYVSNDKGTDFSLTLTHNVRTRYGSCDFTGVKGIQGIYLANARYEDDMSMIYSLISYNEGATWDRLPKPDNYNDCSGNCYLNLVGNSDFRSKWLTNKHSPGVIVAMGSVGNHLDTKNLMTLISRDAGKSWNKIADGRHLYQLDETGSILVMVNNAVQTKNLLYSFDYGITWDNCYFPNGLSLQVDYLIDVPGKAKFIVFGRRGNKLVSISINFEDTTRTCQYFYAPDSSRSDFETWSPNHCINGKELSFTRKKPADCIVPSNFDTSQVSVLRDCVCTRDDYQCDYCFKPNSQGNCVVDDIECPGYDPTRQPVPCSNTYEIPSGYRKVPGDTCRAGKTFPPETRRCH